MARADGQTTLAGEGQPVVQPKQIVLPDARTPVIEREGLAWRHPMLSEACAIDLRKLFDFGPR